MDETTAMALLFGVVLLIIFGITTGITLWVAHRIYKFFGGK